MRDSPPVDRLLLALAEQLKTPLVRIAQLSEVRGQEESETVAALSRHALHSIDALLFAQQQMVFELEPVSVGAVLYDVAHDLSVATRGQDVHIEIDQRGRALPVMAHAMGLRTILHLVGDVLLQSRDIEGGRPQRIVLGCHRTGDKLVVGTFGTGDTLTRSSLALARKLYGRASQVAPAIGLSGGASLVIADTLAMQLQSMLAVYQHASLRGLGVALTPSKQLQLVT